MTNFAQALTRVEYLSWASPSDTIATDELKQLLHQHADSIVQLAKVAADMRDRCQIYQLDMGGNHTYHTNSASINEFVKAYDKLMKEEE